MVSALGLPTEAAAYQCQEPDRASGDEVFCPLRQVLSDSSTGAVSLDDSGRVQWATRLWPVPVGTKVGDASYEQLYDRALRELERRMSPAVGCGAFRDPFHHADFWQGPGWTATLTTRASERLLIPVRAEVKQSPGRAECRAPI